jgi:MFS family permease
MGFGATPFLLPLLFQLGFGRTPIESGALTFVSAVGAVLMKLVSRPLLQRFGFRRLLVANAALVGAMIMGMGLLERTTPTILVLTLLLVSGFFRSLQFTCMGALAYADLEPRQMAGGTTIVSVGQQISMSLGVAVGATVLGAATRLLGEAAPRADAFGPAFLAVGAIPFASMLIFARLSPSAGEELSGHHAALVSADRD